MALWLGGSMSRVAVKSHEVSYGRTYLMRLT